MDVRSFSNTSLNMNVVFDKNWFLKHQSKLLWLLNNALTQKWFRWVLCIDYKGVINRIEPNAYWFGAKKKGNKIEVTADFRTHAKYSKRLYYAFLPIWWAMHIWDLFIDNTLPKLSFGFSTLTVFPNAGDPGTVSIDGDVGRSTATETFATIRSSAGNNHNSNVADNDCALILASTSANRYDFMRRAIFLFDTSSIGSSQVVSDATLSLFGTVLDTSNGLGGAQGVALVNSSPASNTTLANTDYGNVGTTRYATDIPIGSWSTSAYNVFTLNATGISNIAKTGVTKTGTAVSGDVDNVEPTWSSGGQASASCNFADQAGTTNDPKLVVNYSLPNSNFLMFFGPQPQQ